MAPARWLSWARRAILAAACAAPLASSAGLAAIPPRLPLPASEPTAAISGAAGALPRTGGEGPGGGSRLLRTAGLAGSSALLAGAAYGFHVQAGRAFDRYRAAESDFDRKWTAVLRWELSRDAAVFAAVGLALSALVSATTGENPGTGAIFSAAALPGGFCAAVAVPLPRVRRRTG